MKTSFSGANKSTVAATRSRGSFRAFVFCALLVTGIAVVGCDAIISITGGRPSASFQVSASTVSVNTRIELDASGSKASRGELVYRWFLVEKPAASDTRIRPADSVYAEIRPDRAGEYTIRLEVTDAHGRATETRSVFAESAVSN